MPQNLFFSTCAHQLGKTPNALCFLLLTSHLHPRVEMPLQECPSQEDAYAMPYNDNNDDDDDFEKPTPLPIFELLSVFLIQLSEPITATVIYPFINELVGRTGITNGDEKKTGYYAGVIVNTKFFGLPLS